MDENQEQTLETHEDNNVEQPQITIQLTQPQRKVPMTEEQIQRKQRALELAHEKLQHEIKYKQQTEKQAKKGTPMTRSECCNAKVEIRQICTACEQRTARKIGLPQTAKTIARLALKTLITLGQIKEYIKPTKIIKTPLKIVVWTIKTPFKIAKWTFNYLTTIQHGRIEPDRGDEMGNRYFVSGEQLARLKATATIEERDLIDEIIEEQYIGTSQNNIREDCSEARREVCLTKTSIKQDKEEIPETYEQKINQLGLNRDYTEAELILLGMEDHEFRRAIKEGDIYETPKQSGRYRKIV